MVFTLSRKTFARFSSPFGTLTLKILVEVPGAEPAMMPGSGFGSTLLAVVNGLPVSKSIMSGCLNGLCGAVTAATGVGGNAVICGIKSPLAVFEATVSRPKI